MQLHIILFALPSNYETVIVTQLVTTGVDLVTLEFLIGEIFPDWQLHFSGFQRKSSALVSSCRRVNFALSVGLTK